MKCLLKKSHLSKFETATECGGGGGRKRREGEEKEGERAKQDRREERRGTWSMNLGVESESREPLKGNNQTCKKSVQRPGRARGRKTGPAEREQAAEGQTKA